MKTKKDRIGKSKWETQREINKLQHELHLTNKLQHELHLTQNNLNRVQNRINIILFIMIMLATLIGVLY